MTLTICAVVVAIATVLRALLDLRRDIRRERAEKEMWDGYHRATEEIRGMQSADIRRVIGPNNPN